ncbi:MAG: hypothetical protein AAGI07_16855 [Bacteroidota bacterium]
MEYWTQEEVSLQLLDCSQIVDGEVCIRLSTFKAMVFDPKYPPEMFDESVEVIKDLENKIKLQAS